MLTQGVPRPGTWQFGPHSLFRHWHLLRISEFDAAKSAHLPSPPIAASIIHREFNVRRHIVMGPAFVATWQTWGFLSPLPFNTASPALPCNLESVDGYKFHAFKALVERQPSFSAQDQSWTRSIDTLNPPRPIHQQRHAIHHGSRRRRRRAQSSGPGPVEGALSSLW
jgi:hypothetical protein